MRKRLCAIFFALTATIGISGGTVFGAAKTTQGDTITLETQSADDEVAVDLGWKTQQDKGRWIDKMGIADDVNSLVLIINNIENDTDTVKTNTGNVSGDKVVKVERKQLPGNSRMLYLSRTEKGDWQENFSVNCYISGGQDEDSDIYGVYRLESAFGSENDPGKSRPVSETDIGRLLDHRSESGWIRCYHRKEAVWLVVDPVCESGGDASVLELWHDPETGGRF